jgi:hypothetical protein
VASDVEEETFVGDGPADSADIMLVLFDDEHVMAGLGEIVRRSSARRDRLR